MKSGLLSNLLYISVLLLALPGCKSPDNRSDINKIQLTELDGDVIDLNDFEGKTVFVNFWATWCGPCIKEMPSIERARALLKEKDVVFLIASNEGVSEIKNFLEGRSFDLHYVRLLNMEELAIPALPTTFIYDESGKLKYSETGLRDWSTNENLNLIIQ